MNKKNIFLTGATGTMGFAGLKELLKHSENFNITILARSSKVNIKKLKPFEEKIHIVWGDLTKYDDVLEGVTGADYVLHVGGMVSPKADYFPNKTRKVNILAAQNIVKAVLAQPNKDDIKVVNIATVALTSDRNEPIHWGRTGDPICISVYDHYAISKATAERIFADSGLKHWVSLRQSGILYPEILKNFDPIMFHVPLKGVLEWATLEDSARLLANVCKDTIPEDFWNNFYNISSGSQYRMTNYEFECKLLKTISCPPPEKIFNPEWFVTRNFHGQFYLDADKLENFLHFRANIPVDEYFSMMKKSIPSFFNLAKIVPPFIIKWVVKPMAYKKKWGTQDWIKSGDSNRIHAYYGSREQWEAIPRSWKSWNLAHPSSEPIVLNHGYDESKPRTEWTIEDMKQAAEFRGGQCLSDSMTKGDFATPLEWKCQFGHTFKASPLLVLEGGHWCPDCLPTPWNYDEIAKSNPFFAQVWYPVHGKCENNKYGEEIFEGWEEK